MAHSRDDLALPPSIRCQLSVHRVRGEVDNGSVSSNVEDGVIVLEVHIGELLGVCQFLADGLVLEELNALFVTLECLLCRWSRVGLIGYDGRRRLVSTIDVREMERRRLDEPRRCRDQVVGWVPRGRQSRWLHGERGRSTGEQPQGGTSPVIVQRFKIVSPPVVDLTSTTKLDVPWASRRGSCCRRSR